MRFEQDDLSLLMTIESNLFDIHDGGFPIDDLTHRSIDKEKLRVQLEDLPPVLGLCKVDGKKNITSISRILTIAEIFNSLPAAQQ